MNEEKKKPTIFDVARLARVSTTTVSRVINNLPTVKDSNRIRVEQAIKELGFVPDASAQRLAGGKTLSIGFVFPFYENMFSTFYSMELLRGVSQGVIENEVELLSMHFSTGKENGTTGVLNTSYISGILFADYHPNQSLIAKAREMTIPHLITNYYNAASAENCIGVDNLKAAIEATNFLLELGHKKIATITGEITVLAGSDRLAGYKEALLKKGTSINEDYIIKGNWSGQSGYQGMKKLLSLKERPTAVFVAGDEMAMEAENAILEAGLNIPGDISLIGFDDIPLASISKVPLTTMRQPLFELGRQGVNCLAQILSGKLEEPVKKLLSAELVKRKSCTLPKK